MRPSGTGAADRVFGLVIGLVTDVLDPDGLGRVKVVFPWYANGYEEWARVAQLYAGPGYGSTWIPEVDTEVLVGFAHGDMRFPHVVGSLYNPVDTPPFVRDQRTDTKTLLTPGGLELAFDEPASTIQLRTASGATITLEDSGTITIEATTKLVLKAASVEIEGSQDVTVRGGRIALN